MDNFDFSEEALKKASQSKESNQAEPQGDSEAHQPVVQRPPMTHLQTSTQDSAQQNYVAPPQPAATQAPQPAVAPVPQTQPQPQPQTQPIAQPPQMTQTQEQINNQQVQNQYIPPQQAMYSPPVQAPVSAPLPTQQFAPPTQSPTVPSAATPPSQRDVQQRQDSETRPPLEAYAPAVPNDSTPTLDPQHQKADTNQQYPQEMIQQNYVAPPQPIAAPSTQIPPIQQTSQVAPVLAPVGSGVNQDQGSQLLPPLSLQATQAPYLPPEPSVAPPLMPSVQSPPVAPIPSIAPTLGFATPPVVAQSSQNESDELFYSSETGLKPLSLNTGFSVPSLGGLPEEGIEERVKRVLRSYLNLPANQEIPQDEDGDIPLKWQDSLYFINVALEKVPPIIRVWSTVLTNIPRSTPLLEDINGVNEQIIMSRVFWQDGSIIACTEILAEKVDIEELSQACWAVGSLVAWMDTEYQANYGGNIVSAPEEALEDPNSDDE